MTMHTEPSTYARGFAADDLRALHVVGISERWAAVQQRLHPQLVALAETLEQALSQQLPRLWGVYECSYKDARRVNRGPAGYAPIEEYHLAIDRPPRGSGVYVVISGIDQQIIVAIQLWGRRKPELRRIWEEERAIWEPLVQRMHEVRFAGVDPRTKNQEPRTKRTDALRASSKIKNHSVDAHGGSQELENSKTQSALVVAEAKQPLFSVEHPVESGNATWLDRYLSSSNAAYLLAGFSYRWDDPRVAQPAFLNQLVADVLALLPLNEAIMEQAELREPRGMAIIREQHATYAISPDTETIMLAIRARGLALPAATIRAYHLALQTRPFAILPGISGTGKTRLTRLYADVIHGVGEGRENEHYLLVAVQPDWHNARDLLGYYNALTGTFHATPFLRFMLRAAAEPDVPYFVCLDEMNLARPEYYLAPILSALETDDRLIDLGAPGTSVALATGELLQNPFRVPRNLVMTGTVNIDESTHTLSDKLLDRANVIELTDIDLAAFRETWNGVIDPQAWQLISQVHAILARAGQPFGYRTLSEMLRYLEHAQGILTRTQALDQQIKQKILPKLRGEETPRLRRALSDLLVLTLGEDPGSRAATILPETVAHALLPESAEKLRRMLERLDADGFTDFYS